MNMPTISVVLLALCMLCMIGLIGKTPPGKEPRWLTKVPSAALMIIAFLSCSTAIFFIEKEMGIGIFLFGSSLAFFISPSELKRKRFKILKRVLISLGIVFGMGFLIHLSYCIITVNSPLLLQMTLGTIGAILFGIGGVATAIRPDDEEHPEEPGVSFFTVLAILGASIALASQAASPFWSTTAWFLLIISGLTIFLCIQSLPKKGISLRTKMARLLSAGISLGLLIALGAQTPLQSLLESDYYAQSAPSSAAQMDK